MARRRKRARSSSPAGEGVLLVGKPPGVTSAQAVASVKRRLRGAKVGHFGTLDPFASGLLPMGIGQGTKLAAVLTDEDKEYEGVIRLGVTTDTLDITGTVLGESRVPAISRPDLTRLARDFTGLIDQVPPAYSAIKRGGVRMYELARRGQAPDLPPRPVTIRDLALELVDAERIRLRARVSKGTYIRSLARDIGEQLGCGAVLEHLVRTAVGPFHLRDAADLAQLAELEAGTIAARVIGLADALAHLPTLVASDRQADSLRAGVQRILAELHPPTGSGGLAKVVDAAGALVAVVEAQGVEEGWRLLRIFTDTQTRPSLAPSNAPC